MPLILKQKWQNSVSSVRFPRRESLRCGEQRPLGTPEDTRNVTEEACTGDFISHTTTCSSHLLSLQDIRVVVITHSALRCTILKYGVTNTQKELSALNCCQEKLQIVIWIVPIIKLLEIYVERHIYCIFWSQLCYCVYPWVVSVKNTGLQILILISCTTHSLPYKQLLAHFLDFKAPSIVRCTLD